VGLVAAGSAVADVGPMPGVPAGDAPGYNPLPQGQPQGSSATPASPAPASPGITAPPSAGGGTSGGSSGTNGGAGGGATAVSPKPRSPLQPVKTVKRCTWAGKHHTGARTCTYRRGAAVIRVCVKKPHHRESCRVPRQRHSASGRVAHVATVADTKIGSGFVTSPRGAVVKIAWTYTNTYGQQMISQCSGSLIGPGLVLTAGHCVYSNQPDGNTADHTGFVNYYDPGTYTITPGMNGKGTAPYGTWSVRTMWTTQDYSSGSLGGDWGLIELNRNAAGYYPGQYSGIGYYNATWNQSTIDQLFSTGYPVAGGFSQDQNGDGDLQYYCQVKWSPDASVTDATNFGDYYAFVISPCEETGGASGGPVFTDVNGSWTIVGVNNRSPDVLTATTFGTTMLSFYFNNTFGSFYTSVAQQISQGV
jgi:V8-like Glu-specific endopeptidase